MEKGRCPETSKDANGLADTAGLRFYLMRLGVNPYAIQCQSSTSGVFFVLSTCWKVYFFGGGEIFRGPRLMPMLGQLFRNHVLLWATGV